MSVDMLEKRLRQFEDAEAEVSHFIHEYFGDGGEKIYPSHVPSYISNKILNGKNNINAFGQRESLVYDMMNIVTWISCCIPIQEGYSGWNNDLYVYDKICNEYNKRHGTHYERSKD